MIHYILHQEASVYYGAWQSKSDIYNRGVITPMYRCGSDPFSSVIPHDLFSSGDSLSSEPHNRLGDSGVSHRKAEVTLEPSILEDQLYSSVSGFSPDSRESEYLRVCKTKHPGVSIDMKGSCFYDSLHDTSFAPPQKAFGLHTFTTRTFSSYVIAYHGTKVFSWVPMGNHYALVTTDYSTSTYIGRYQSNSRATVDVLITYVDILQNGSVVTHNVLTKRVLSVSGDGPQHVAIVAFAVDLHPDPTSYARDYIAAISPISGEPASLPFHYVRRFDPRASSESFMDRANSRISKLVNRLSENSIESQPTYDEWADLADTAIDNCKFVDINAYAFARDLRSTGSELKSVMQLLANPTNPKRWASLYLGLRYGTRLTVADTRELMSGLKRSSSNMRSTWSKDYMVVRSMKSSFPPDFPGVVSSSRELHYKVYYKPDDSILKRGLKRLWDWDMYPSLQNLWDLIPYSFCVDWVGNIESTLETLDRRQYEELIHVLGCTYSSKDEYYYPLKLTDLGYQDATVVVTVYHRRIKPSLHQSSLRLTTGHPSTINVIDGISLILQRVK